MSEYELYHHGVLGQKWGIRKDRKHSSNALSIYNTAKRREPMVTRAVKSSVIFSGGQMYGLENCLKTPQSIHRKLDLGKEINDALRYTAILSEDNFVEQYNSTKFKMMQKGYEETRCKNYFQEYQEGKVNHKSVQCNYSTPDGYIFELQFQTKASQRAKDKKTKLYEEARDPNTTEARKQELISQMRDLAEEVNDPPGIFNIEEH